MSTDLSPAEQARAHRLSAKALYERNPNAFEASRYALGEIADHLDPPAPPETVESLRAERDTARDETKRVSERWLKDARERSEELFLTKAALDDADATIARLRASHTEAEAARGRCKPDRVWRHNDPEPDGVNRVTDIDGDEWGKANGKWRHPHAGPSRSWANLLNAYGPLTEVISR